MPSGQEKDQTYSTAPGPCTELHNIIIKATNIIKITTQLYNLAAYDLMTLTTTNLTSYAIHYHSLHLYNGY